MNVNKAELCQLLSCSKPTLDGWIAKHHDFPVVQKGSPGRDYVFDHEQVRDFLHSKSQADLEADRERAAHIRQLALPLGHNGGPALDEGVGAALKPSELLALMKVRKLQREEEYECGRLVKVTEIQQAVSDFLAGVGRATRAWVSQCAVQFDLSRDQQEQMLDGFIEVQRKLVDEFDGHFAAEQQSDLPLVIQLANQAA